MICQKLYPQGKVKAITFSYDDGVAQDAELVRLFNRYHVKAAFNLNSGLDGKYSNWKYKGVPANRMPFREMPSLYDGHEIAAHSRTHAHLEQLDTRRLYEELFDDRTALSEYFHCEVKGIALPFGSWNNGVMEAVSRLGFLYCRVTETTHDFSLPENFHQWRPTSHHIDPDLMTLAEQFRETQQEMALFYVWGHSYEFDGDRNWSVMENFLKAVAGHEDTWYASNQEIAAYVTAMRRLVVGDDFFLNPTSEDLWVRAEERVLRIPAGKWVNL